MKNKYRSGIIAEGKVVRDLKEKGFENVRQSKGSRGPADIYASKDGQKYYIQVKKGSATLDEEGKKKLQKLAEERKGVAVYVHREDAKNRWRFLGNWGNRR